MQSARAQTRAAEGFPEGLAIGGQVALACGGDGNEHHGVLDPVAEAGGIEVDDVGVEAQALGQPAHVGGHVERIARLGAVDDEGSPGVHVGRAVLCFGYRRTRM